MGHFLLFMCISSQIFRRSDDFFAKFRENSFALLGSTVNVIGISTFSGIHAVMGLPSAVDVCDARIVCNAVANVLVVSSCCYSWCPC
jgi:hypothetical protein